MSRKKFFWTAEQDELIRKRYDSRTETITDLARIFSVPRWVVRRRAGMLGISRVKERPWSPEEVAFLEAHYSRRSPFWLSKRLNRSITAILMKKKRLGLRKTDDGYTLRMVCEGFGVDHHKVEYWIERGWLKSRGRGVMRPQGDYKFFTDEALRRFVRKHPTRSISGVSRRSGSSIYWPALISACPTLRGSGMRWVWGDQKEAGLPFSVGRQHEARQGREEREMDYCRIILHGRLTQDPEIRYNGSGAAVTSFSVAINRKFRKGEEGKLTEAVTFVPIRSYGKTAEHAVEHLGKGRAVLIEGEIRSSEWKGEGGETRQRLYVAAQKIIYLGKANGKAVSQQGPTDTSEADVPF